MDVWQRLPKRVSERVRGTFYRRDKYVPAPGGGDGMVLERCLVYWNGTGLRCHHKRRMDRCAICLSGKCRHRKDPERCVECLMLKPCPHIPSPRARIGSCRQCLEVLHCPEHDRRILDCPDCTRRLKFCDAHQHARATCTLCRPKSKSRCACGKSLSICKTCPGGGRALCTAHGKQLAFCASCPGGGSALCDHGKQKYHCRMCRLRGESAASLLYCGTHGTSRRDRCVGCRNDRKAEAQAKYDAYLRDNEEMRPPHVEDGDE